MSEIVAKAFRSDLALDRLIERLEAAFPDFEWGKRESEHFDVYANGRAADGTRITVMREGPQAWEITAYLPETPPAGRRDAVVTALEACAASF